MSRIRAELAAAMLLAAAATASAETIAVTTGADDVANPPAGSLRAAAAAAQPGDVIEIAAGVTVELAADLDLGSTASLTVRAAQPGTARVTHDGEVDPGVQLRMLAHMDGGAFRDLTFVHLGLELGNASNVQIRSCSFVHNRASVRVIGSDHVVLERNSFQGCSDGVLSEGSSDVAIRDCRFTECGYGVNSEDDAALEITRCTMRGMTGVEIHGSAGTVEGNDFVPQAEGERGEVAIFAGTRSQGPPSIGPLSLSGNRIRLSGARGILVISRSDVTIENNEIAGRGAGLGISVAPRGVSSDTPTVTGNTVTGAFFGIYIDCEEAGGQAVILKDNVVSRADQGITFVGNRTSSCTIESSRVSACRNGIVVTGSGAVAGVVDTTVRGCGVAGLSVGEETIVHATDLVARQNRDGIAVAPRAHLKLGGSVRFDGCRLAGVFADVTARVLLDEEALVGGQPTPPNPKQPLYDIAPRGAVTPGFTATLFGTTLSVSGTAGAGTRYVWLFGPDRNASTFHHMDTEGHASFDVTGRVPGAYEVRVVGTYFPGLPQLPGSFSRIEASVWVRLP